jgi:hypothetical protein
LIIEFVNFEVINKLIKNELSNDYSHRAYKYFEKKCKSNNAFDVKSMITSIKSVEITRNAIFVHASILRFNAEHSTNIKNVLIASTNILREAFNATLKRRKSKNSTQFETTSRSCISKHRQTKTQRRQKIDLTLSRSRKCVRSLRFNKQ